MTTSHDLRLSAARAWLTDAAWVRCDELWRAADPAATLTLRADGTHDARNLGPDAPLILSETSLIHAVGPNLTALAAGLGDVRGKNLMFIGCGSGDLVRAARAAGATALVIEVDDRHADAAGLTQVTGPTEVECARDSYDALARLAAGSRVVVWIANAVAALPALNTQGYAPHGIVDLARDVVLPNGYPPRAAETLARLNPLEYTRLLLQNRIDLARARRPFDERGAIAIEVPRAESFGARAVAADPADHAWLANASGLSGDGALRINAAVADRTLVGPVALARRRADRAGSVMGLAKDAALGALYADARGNSVMIADGTDAATARIKRWTSDNC